MKVYQSGTSTYGFNKIWSDGFSFTPIEPKSSKLPKAEVEVKVVHPERKLLTGEIAKPELIKSDIVLGPIRFAIGSCRRRGAALASASRGEKQGTVRLRWNKPVSYIKIVSLMFQHAERNL